MPNNFYRQGEDLARCIKKLMEADGYYVMKSGGSRGIIDLIAIKSCGAGIEILFIQAKKQGKIGPADRDKLVTVARDRQPPCLCCRVVPLVAEWVSVGHPILGPKYTELTGARIDQQRPWNPDHALELA